MKDLLTPVHRAEKTASSSSLRTVYCLDELHKVEMSEHSTLVTILTKRLKDMQAQVNKFCRHWSQLAGPNLFVRNKWHTVNRNVAVEDIVWMADQNALRGQFRLARVVSVNPDSKGIVRDVNVRTLPSYPVPVTRPTTAKANQWTSKKLKEDIPATVLHRDVRRLVVLLPIEEQNRASDPSLPR